VYPFILQEFATFQAFLYTILMLKFFISAGEYSGDIHAAYLVRELKKIFPDAIFSGIGGDNMRREGVELIQHINDMGIIGFQEALRGVFKLRNLLKMSIEVIKNMDICIFVDYPGFNLKLSSYTKRAGKINYYYIAPQVWAWWNFRVKFIKKNFDYVFVILPFEEHFYRKYGIRVKYVGSPVLDSVLNAHVKEIKIPEGKKIIGLLPGSRYDEVRRLVPRLMKIKKILEEDRKDLHFLMSLVPDFKVGEEENLTILRGEAYEIMNASDFLIVASGTASLEAALFGKPMVVIYALSEFSWILAKLLARVKYASLVNILADEMVVPEFIQHIPEREIARLILEYLDNKELYNNTMSRILKIRDSLKPGAARRAALLIKKEVEKYGYA